MRYDPGRHVWEPLSVAEVGALLPVGEGRRATEYRILVSFQLTPEDLALLVVFGPAYGSRQA